MPVMKRGIFAVLLFLSCLSKGSAEVVIEFDGKNWVGDNKDANFEKRVAEEGLCIVADAKCQVGDFLRDLDLDKYHAPSIRFALKGIEGKGAKFDTVQRKEDPRKTRIVATCHTTGVDIGYIDMETNTLKKSNSTRLTRIRITASHCHGRSGL